MWGGDERWGNQVIMKLKTNVISAATEKKQCVNVFLLSEACLTAYSRGWVQHCGMTLVPESFFIYVLIKSTDIQSARV